MIFKLVLLLCWIYVVQENGLVFICIVIWGFFVFISLVESKVLEVSSDVEEGWLGFVGFILFFVGIDSIM